MYIILDPLDKQFSSPNLDFKYFLSNLPDKAIFFASLSSTNYKLEILKSLKIRNKFRKKYCHQVKIVRQILNLAISMKY